MTTIKKAIPFHVEDVNNIYRPRDFHELPDKIDVVSISTQSAKNEFNKADLRVFNKWIAYFAKLDKPFAVTTHGNVKKIWVERRGFLREERKKEHARKNMPEL